MPTHTCTCHFPSWNKLCAECGRPFAAEHLLQPELKAPPRCDRTGRSWKGRPLSHRHSLGKPSQPAVKRSPFLSCSRHCWAWFSENCPQRRARLLSKVSWPTPLSSPGSTPAPSAATSSSEKPWIRRNTREWLKPAHWKGFESFHSICLNIPEYRGVLLPTCRTSHSSPSDYQLKLCDRFFRFYCESFTLFFNPSSFGTLWALGEMLPLLPFQLMRAGAASFFRSPCSHSTIPCISKLNISSCLRQFFNTNETSLCFLCFI